MSIITQLIDSMLLLVSLLLFYTNCENEHNFDLFIDSVPSETFLNNDQDIGCGQNGCTKIQFSLPDMKFWEVWKEDNKDADPSDTPTTDSPHWPNPPAIWGESVMGQQSSSRSPTRPPYKQPKGPIITKLDKIVDVLRPVSEQNSDEWRGFSSDQMVQKPESRYDHNSDNYYDYEIHPKSVDKRNLKKYVIEEKVEKEDKPEIIIKKRQKKPTIFIEEELIPVEEEPKKEVVYKIKKKPKPKTQHIIIEEDGDNEEDVEEEVIYQKAPKKDKLKEIYILANGDVREEYTAPPTTRAPVITITKKPTENQKKRKTMTENEDNNELEERNVNEEDYEYESDDEDKDEEPWGSASPQTRVKPNRTKKERNLDPFSVLRRLRPPMRPRPYRRPPPYHHNRPPHQHHHQGGGGMVPGGTFRMRFYMDGPKNYRESDDDPDY